MAEKGLVRFLTVILLIGQVWLHLLQGKFYQRQIWQIMLKVGPGSLFPVLLVAGFAGMIFTVQTARELVDLGAVNAVGSAFAVGFCRELAPILTACIIAGQAGSGFAAEIGAMQITEQIDALYILRTDPIDFLVVPRAIACCLTLPILIVFALVMGTAGGTFAAAIFYEIPPATFLTSIQNFFTVSDLIIVVFKGFIFGVLVAGISCSWGLTTYGGVKQVGESATQAVVSCWIWIFISDFFLSLLLFDELIF